MNVFPVPTSYDSKSTSSPLEISHDWLITDCISHAKYRLNQSSSTGYDSICDSFTRNINNSENDIFALYKNYFFNKMGCGLHSLLWEDDSQTKPAEIQRYESIIKKNHFIDAPEECQDWDKPLPKPKIHRSGKIAVRLHFSGRGKPLPFDES
ncbi:MAG TPA: hypothetical protein PKV38_05400 [bacterium]|nr:hypothetical protein [bacterium]